MSKPHGGEFHSRLPPAPATSTPLLTSLQVAGSLLVDLNETGVQAEAIDCDDRRNVFHVVCVGNRKSIIMQAENERERDEVRVTSRRRVRLV